MKGFFIFHILVFSFLRGEAQASYLYDSQNRLIMAHLDKCITLKYQYDVDGNRITAQKAQIIVTPTIIDNPCSGISNGSISLQGASNTNYNYIWSNSQSGPYISNLAPGFYSVSITDQTSNYVCIKSYQVRQQVSDTVRITPTNVTCHGYNTGRAIIDTLTLDISDYTFHWSNGANDFSLQGLSAGNYTLTATNIHSGCIQVVPFSITQPAAFISSISVDSLRCNNSNDGYVAINVVSGLSNYSFNWSNGNTTNALLSVPAGIFYVTVIETTTGCSERDTIEIHEPRQINTSITTLPSCADHPTGSIIISGTTGGTPPYSYLIDSGINFMMADTFRYLAPENHLTIVQDSHFCLDTFDANISSIDCTTGLHQYANNQFSIYPSPTKGDFFVVFSCYIGQNYSIEIFNGLGQLVKSLIGTANGNFMKTAIRLDNASVGRYTVRLNTNDTSQVKDIEIVK